MTIKLIINQSKLESDALNTFVNLLAWISQIISDWLSPIFFDTLRFWDQRGVTPLYSGSLTSLTWRSDRQVLYETDLTYFRASVLNQHENS
jgi:hypothetical protein